MEINNQTDIFSKIENLVNSNIELKNSENLENKNSPKKFSKTTKFTQKNYFQIFRMKQR